MTILERALMFESTNTLIIKGYVRVEKFASQLQDALNEYYGENTFDLDEDISIAGCERMLSLMSKQKLLELSLIDTEALLADYRWNQSSMDEDLADTRRHEQDAEIYKTPDPKPIV